jgi:hypothetical protein
MPLPDWIPFVRAGLTRALHDEAWAPELVDDVEGLTVFQRRTEAACTEVCMRHGIGVSRTVTRGWSDDPTEAWVGLALDGHALGIGIYLDQVNIGDDHDVDVRIERWEARTPEEARAKAVAALEQLLAAPGARGR